MGLRRWCPSSSSSFTLVEKKLFDSAEFRLVSVGRPETYGLLTGKCEIPECENTVGTVKFNESWISQAIPTDHNSLPHRCHRFKPIYSPDSFNSTNYHHNSCYPYIFDTDKKVKCDSWIFKDSETTIATEFNLICSGEEWKIAMVGTMNYLGFLTGMPVAGVFADRYGRKNTLAVSCFIQSLFGVIRSFSPNYEIFLLLLFLGAFMSGAYNSGFILGLEIVGPKKRVLGNAIISCFHSIGEAIVGLLMWKLKDWRLLLIYLFVPGLFSFVYVWIIPESIRWLIAKGRTDKAVEVFNKMARVNKKTLPSDLNNNSFQFTDQINFNKDNTENFKQIPLSEQMKVKFNVNAPSSLSLSEIVKSRILMIRLIILTLCWMVVSMLFYGSPLISVSIQSENKYILFILMTLVELPGYICTWLLMDIIKVGRRFSLAVSLIINGLTCIAYTYLPGIPLARLILFLSGKFSITIAFGVIYIFTAEMFPTEMRNSILGICSMAGHFGSMLAPQTILLTKIIDPVLLWGILALTAGMISTIFPETLNMKLPDTIEQAEHIGL